MVIIACTCMTFMHPGYAFQNRWNDTKFPFFYNHFQPTTREIKQEDPGQQKGEDLVPVRLTDALHEDRVESGV